jgi:hypothetical protein
MERVGRATWTVCAARVAARESGDERVKSVDASVGKSKTVNYHLAFALHVCSRFGLHLRYSLQPRRQMNRRNDAASAAATKFNGRKFKRHQAPVAT